MNASISIQPRSAEKEGDERNAMIAIPRRFIRDADSQLAYFLAEREGDLRGESVLDTFKFLTAHTRR